MTKAEREVMREIGRGIVTVLALLGETAESRPLASPVRQRLSKALGKMDLDPRYECADCGGAIQGPLLCEECG